jgi:hypothetical protein
MDVVRHHPGRPLFELVQQISYPVLNRLRFPPVSALSQTSRYVLRAERYVSNLLSENHAGSARSMITSIIEHNGEISLVHTSHD